MAKGATLKIWSIPRLLRELGIQVYSGYRLIVAPQTASQTQSTGQDFMKL